nr:LptF/LptG family permease [Chitinophagaceae bacterium]
DNAIIAEKGKMQITPDKNFLEFTLQNGYRYEQKGDASSPDNEFIKMGFKEYKKLFDLSQLNIQTTADSLFSKNFRVENVKQLDKAIDSLNRYPDSFARRIQFEFNPFMFFLKLKNSEVNAIKQQPSKVKNFDDLIPDTLKYTVQEQALNSVSSMQNIISVIQSDASDKSKDMRLHLMEWHKKFSLSIACLVLFFIGAPLGAIIRKGGLGLPLVVAVVFFLIFHLLNTFGEKLVKENLINPLGGMWLSVIVLTPIGGFLIYKAARDSQFFSKEFYYRSFRRLVSNITALLSIFKREK